MSILFSSVFSGLTVIIDRQFGFLKEIMVAPVKRIYIVLGRIAGGMTTSLIQGILILLITLLIGFKISGILPFMITLVFMILIAMTFIGLGLVFASRMKDPHGFQLVVNFVVFPIFFLSGALSPIDSFPRILKYLTYIDPLTYGVDGMRAVLIGSSSFPLLTDLIAMAGFAIAMILISAYMFEKSEAM
jgi:ABC-2 type transport system permease protein